MDTILRSSKNKRISRYILRKEDLVEASRQAIFIDKTAFRGVLQTKDHTEVFYGENTCRILLWTEDFQRSSSDSRPFGDVLQHEDFHSSSIDRTFARGLLQTPKRHSRGILLISERPSRDLLSSEDPPEDFFRQKAFQKVSVDIRPSRGFLWAKDSPEVFQKPSKDRILVQIARRPFRDFLQTENKTFQISSIDGRPSRGLLQRKDLSEVFYRQQTFQLF